MPSGAFHQADEPPAEILKECKPYSSKSGKKNCPQISEMPALLWIADLPLHPSEESQVDDPTDKTVVLAFSDHEW